MIPIYTGANLAPLLLPPWGSRYAEISSSSIARRCRIPFFIGKRDLGRVLERSAGQIEKRKMVSGSAASTSTLQWRKEIEKRTASLFTGNLRLSLQWSPGNISVNWWVFFTVQGQHISGLYCTCKNKICALEFISSSFWDSEEMSLQQSSWKGNSCASVYLPIFRNK